MKTNSKKLGKCQVELTVTLDADETKAIVKDVEKAFVREAKLPGFRPGKVPIELIRKEFAQGLKQETDRAIFQRNITDAIKAAELDEVAIADVKDITFNTSGASFVATVEVKPTFKLPAYKELKIEKKDTAVSEETVQDHLGRLRTAYAKYEDAQEGEAVSEGDFVQIDYTGTVDGKPILEIAPDAKIVANGTGFWTQVEEGRFLPEILEAVKGMKAGETKEGVKATFDKESAPDGLKGAKAVYTVTLKTLRRRVLPDDATLAEKAKSESFEKLKATVRESMERAKVEGEKRRREDEAVELLLKKVDFDVPQTQVDSVMQGMLSEMAQRAQLSGLDASYFEQNAEKIRKDAAESAERQVRLWYVIEAIAKAEKIEADDKEIGRKVVEFVLANAKK